MTINSVQNHQNRSYPRVLLAISKFKTKKRPKTWQHDPNTGSQVDPRGVRKCFKKHFKNHVDIKTQKALWKSGSAARGVDLWRPHETTIFDKSEGFAAEGMRFQKLALTNAVKKGDKGVSQSCMTLVMHDLRYV